MRWLLLIILSVVALSFCARVGAAEKVDPGARRAQVSAATCDAIEGLRRDVLSTSLTPEMTVEQFIQRTGSKDALDQALHRAEQIGGTRWLDDETCQVRLQLPGSEVADAIVKIADTKPRDLGIPAEVIRQRVDRLRERTFAATGMSTGAIDRLRPRPDQVAWKGVPDAAVRSALHDARRNAAAQVLQNVEPVVMPSGKARLSSVLSDAKVRSELEGWLMSRPVTSAEFRDDLEVRVGVAPDAEAFWNELATAAGDRKDLGFPTDPDARERLRSDVIRRIEPTVGRAVAKAPTGGGNARALMAVDIPRDPPRWIGDQLDVTAPSKRVDGPLKTARAAESAARDKLRQRIEQLPLSPKLTLGEAARRDDRVRAAVDRTVKNARPRKVIYHSDGGAEVSFSLDLRDLWYELDAR
jgi:hypothetical protein